MKDPFIAEIRKFREAHAKRFNYDIRAMVEDLRKSEAQNPNLIRGADDVEGIARVTGRRKAKTAKVPARAKKAASKKKAMG